MGVLARSSVLAQVPRELHTLKHFARAMVTGLNPYKLFAGGLWRGTDVSTVRAFLDRLVNSRWSFSTFGKAAVHTR